MKLKQDAEKTENELRDMLKGSQMQNKDFLETTQNTISSLEEQLREKQREVLAQTHDFDQDKALFNQKAEFLEQALAEYKKKEQEWQTTTRASKKQHLE